MSLTIFLIILATALVHAVWNALLKNNGNPWDNVTAVSYATGSISLVALFFLPLPDSASWPYLLASGGTQFYYLYLLSKVYEKGEYAVGYPLMRGLSLPFVALFSYLFLHEVLSPSEMLGLAGISGGILLMAFSALHDLTAFKKQAGLALTCAMMVAYYMMMDGTGARLSGNSASYTVWIYLLQASGVFIFRTLRKDKGVIPIGHWNPWMVAVLSIIVYIVQLWAVTKAPIALVSALRESSVLFSALVGFIILREKPNLFRILSVMVLTAGIIVFRLHF
ncbi:MAG: hypothetical protein EB059_01680 [Alphaproteobacteria bacterium]|nr:hypothetical protein [Alphaproteobacteria bacterium]